MNLNDLKYVEELRNVGMPERQAEARICILNEVVESELVFKQDVVTIQLRIETVREELKRDIKELELRLIHVDRETGRTNGARSCFDRDSCESSIISSRFLQLRPPSKSKKQTITSNLKNHPDCRKFSKLLSPIRLKIKTSYQYERFF